MIIYFIRVASLFCSFVFIKNINFKTAFAETYYKYSGKSRMASVELIRKPIMSFVKTVGCGEGLMRKLNEDTEKFFNIKNFFY